MWPIINRLSSSHQGRFLRRVSRLSPLSFFPSHTTFLLYPAPGPCTSNNLSSPHIALPLHKPRYRANQVHHRSRLSATAELRLQISVGTAFLISSVQHFT